MRMNTRPLGRRAHLTRGTPTDGFRYSTIGPLALKPARSRPWPERNADTPKNKTLAALSLGSRRYRCPMRARLQRGRPRGPTPPYLQVHDFIVNLPMIMSSAA